MKIKTIILIVACFSGVVSPAQVATETYAVDTKESVVTWKGSMQFGAKGSNVGYVKVSKGELVFQKSQLVAGWIDVDMIAMADMIHGKFYSNLADETISDEIELDVKIVAGKGGVPLVPTGITRAVEEDRNGTIWIATFGGMFRYDGKSFTNVTSNVSQARFFSVLEDRKGALWFGTIGSGVFRYDGRSFENFTTKDGLLNNEVGWIYEDKAGNIWFGLNGGTSRYDGKSFRNYMINGDTMIEETSGKTFPDFTRPPNEVTSIIEDKAGNLWFATRGKTFIYNKKGFTVVANKGKAFINVRTIIEDRKGDVWLGGDGLWRYDGKEFINLTKNLPGISMKTGKETFGRVPPPRRFGPCSVMMKSLCRICVLLQPG